ncbi:hypothetical protein HPB52_017670 [Rhipicephalus sanguineus]|uniref:Uncharacterized protein n=1 Tax=Rhipicephalus sanguineus TaxID=34632 RepID=A0A9D4Q1E3_RHISA|nr:hypothetical protein HPB52_017670 [Rhipicephalus sanguineus]
MYAQRYVSSLPRYSLSAPSLGSSSPAPVTRPGCTNTPIDSLGVQHSESSSPTTSLLLQMWGYDQAHAPSSSGRAVDLHPTSPTRPGHLNGCASSPTCSSSVGRL